MGVNMGGGGDGCVGVNMGGGGDGCVGVNMGGAGDGCVWRLAVPGMGRRWATEAPD